MKTRVVAYAVDGKPSIHAVVDDLGALFESPLTSQMVRTVKFNSAFHLKGAGPELIMEAKKVVPGYVSFFGDFKLADVKSTDVDLLMQYEECGLDIVTVSACVSSQALAAIQETLPNTTIAIVSALTDIPEEEFMLRNFGMTPSAKIIKDINDFDQLLGKEKNPIGAIVSSGRCSQDIKRTFGNRFLNITPGIRSAHMAEDHQKQILDAYSALKNGADLLVMYTQLAKGNPAKGISPQESQQITLEEIQRYLAEKQAA